ncbi:MAG TPA: IS481 family transposase [Candidatus Dormibacteraeota bacterium]|nr:IS481 family transposase [Candidatus Dormibacteraeota bacterium]
MSHRRAKLTPFGRLLLVQRVLGDGWPAVRAAESLGVSRATAYKWIARYRAGATAELEDRSSRPRRSPRALPAPEVERILSARRELKQGPHRLAFVLGVPRSTIYRVLRRHGASRLRDFDRLTAVPVRYVREHPGELIHVDIKKLGRIPPGGSHRWLPKRQSMRVSRIANTLRPGYEYVHVAVDDTSRLAFVQVHGDDRDSTAASFILDAGRFFASHGIELERVMTDSGACYRSHRFASALRQLGARHKRTRPYRPQTNGKAERFIRTLIEEWAYARLFSSNDERLDALQAWVDFYNARRPHTGLRGRTPLSVAVSNVLGNFI